MNFLNLIAILAIVVYSVESVGFRGFFYERMKEPEPSEWKRINLVKHRWINQPIDHFHIQDQRTWRMLTKVNKPSSTGDEDLLTHGEKWIRFLENDEYFNGTGPIFIMLGGEWKIYEGFLQAGLMYNIGVEQGALMYYTEHRYYGDSQLFANNTAENLKYLNVDQALADVAYFIESMKKERNLNNSMVVVFGGSYAGSMAAWIRLKYPHLVQGAVASSAPVIAKANFLEYLEVVAESLKKHSVECVSEIQKAFVLVEKIILTEPGKRIIKDELNLCSSPDTSTLSGIGTFITFLTDKFAGEVQYNKITNGKSNIDRICETMTNKNIGSPVQRLANLFNKNEECYDVSYNTVLEILRNTTGNGNSDMMRQWIFQTCTEYGYYQTAESEKSIFGSLLTVEYFTQLCKDVYGEQYGEILMNKGVTRTNVMYGGKFPDVNNVLFINGNIDPWHALSVVEDLNESSPAILIDGSSHCMDLKDDDPNDVEELTKARIRERTIIRQWIQSWRGISNQI